MVLSARTPQALGDQANRLRDLVATAGPDLADVGQALTARASFARRAVVIGGGRDELRDGLHALSNQLPAATVVTGAALDDGEPVFVFPGQGSQWRGMGVTLFEQDPVFRDQLLACADALRPHVGWSLVDVLRGTAVDATLDRVDVVQPALFAVMVSLAAVWRAAGVRPAA